MPSSSSRATILFRDDPPQQDDGQPPCPRRHLLNQHQADRGSDPELDFGSNSSTGLSDSQPPAAALLLRSSLVGASSSVNNSLMTAASVDGPGAPSASRHAQPTAVLSLAQYHTQTDADMTDIDSDSDESDAEFDTGGAPLAAPTSAFQATGTSTAPAVEPDPVYMSDIDAQYYDQDDDDTEDEDQFTQHDSHNHPAIAPDASSLNPDLAYFVNHPTVTVPIGGVGMHVQPVLELGTPVNIDLANLPPLPQPPPGWVPLPAFGVAFEQNVVLSNANPAILGSENLGLVDFLRDWAFQGRYGQAARSQPPHLEELLRQTQQEPKEIDYSQLKGDECDLQGLDWTAMETTRRAARVRRQYTYRNYVNRMGSDKWMSPDEALSSRESFYRFKRMNIRKDVCLAHFQLRSVLACPTRTHAYYPTPQGIARMNLASRKSELFMNLRDFPASGAIVSTLDADCGVLMCGTFNGDYYIKGLDLTDKQAPAEGQITSDISGITNHIKIHEPRRSCGPAAAIASNDHGFRLLDLETQKFVQETMYPFALNCTAVSPDRRLRAVVGDHFNVLITNADTGEVLQELGGHRDYGFACDWSDDGWTVATGFQDMAVKIWDARRWCNSCGVSTPLCTVRTEMAGARSLRFSPLGSGPPVLVGAEEADYINIIDAKMFRYKQEIDVFGEIGGVAFANDGQDLNVLCCDTHRGGLLQLQRCRGRRGFMRRYDDVSLANRRSWLPDTDATPAMHEIPALF